MESRVSAQSGVALAGKIEIGSLVDGRYRVDGILGEGGFATVYLATHVHMGRQVALKVLEARAKRDLDAFEERFLREAQVSAQIEHPNVVTIHDFGFFGAARHPYIAMQLLEGHDLADELYEKRRMTPTRAAHLMIDCLGGLGEAHRLGIVHKDLKPSNLFLQYPGTERERLMLLDFGVARVMGDDSQRTSTGDLYGTPRYLAPEYVDAHVATPALDVYQMALILVEMISGEPVVGHDHPLQCLMAHAEGKLRIPEGMRRGDLGLVLDKALSIDYLLRYKDGFAFRDALAKIDLDPLEAWFAHLPAELPRQGGQKDGGLASASDKFIRRDHREQNTMQGVSNTGPQAKSLPTMVARPKIGLDDTYEARRASHAEKALAAAEPAPPPSSTRRGSSGNPVVWMAIGAVSLLVLGFVGYVVVTGGEVEPAPTDAGAKKLATAATTGDTSPEAVETPKKANKEYPPGPNRMSAITTMAKGAVAHAAIVTSDKGLLVVGQAPRVGRRTEDHDGWVAKFDHRGKKAWSRRLGGDFEDLFKSVTQLRDGTFVVAGSTGSHGNGGFDGWVVKFSQKGEVISNQTFGSSANDGFVASAPTQDGGVVLAGETRSKGAGGHDVWVVRMDNRGQIKWEKTFGGAGTDVATSVLVQRDGRIVVGGYSNSSGFGREDGWLIRLKPGGTPDIERRLGGEFSDGITALAEASKAQGGGLVVTYDKARDPSGNADLHIARFNRRGDLQWDKAIDRPGNTTATGVVLTKNDEFLVASRSTGKKDESPKIVRLSHNGQILWEKDLKTSAVVTDIAALHGKGFALVGGQKAGKKGLRPWVSRIDELGKVQRR